MWIITAKNKYISCNLISIHVCHMLWGLSLFCSPQFVCYCFGIPVCFCFDMFYHKFWKENIKKSNGVELSSTAAVEPLCSENRGKEGCCSKNDHPNAESEVHFWELCFLLLVGSVDGELEVLGWAESVCDETSLHSGVPATHIATSGSR